MKIRTLIVDDETLARDRVRALLAREEDVEIVGECRSGTEAVAAVRELRPDLMFLDIQMPEMDGFGVLEALGAELPAVIFATAFDQYAVKAFEVHALDYLLKPFKPARLKQALARVRQARGGGGGGADEVTGRILALLEERKAAPSSQLTRIAVRSGERVRFVKVDDIDWIEASGNYVILHCGGEKHMLRETMGVMEEKLPGRKFYRVSRSAIVHLERVVEMQPLFEGEHVVALKSGVRINMTRGVRELQERLRFL